MRFQRGIGLYWELSFMVYSDKKNLAMLYSCHGNLNEAAFKSNELNVEETLRQRNVQSVAEPLSPA